MKELKMTDGFGKVRKIGLLSGETLRMWRDRSKHLYRKENAWCIDKDAFDLHSDVKFYIVEETSGINYLTTRQVIEKEGKSITYSGHGEQIAIPLKFWTTFKD